MTSKQISEIARLYIKKLHERGCLPTRMDINNPHNNEQDHLNHAMWMCTMIVEDKVGKTMEKEMRWLCYVQGTLSSFGVFSVNQLRWHNAPDKCSKEIKARVNELVRIKKDVDAELFELLDLMKHHIEEPNTPHIPDTPDES